MEAYKLLIAGSRTFNNYSLLEDEIVKFCQDKEIKISPDSLIIISGTAKGADKLGELFAYKQELFVKRFPADWERFGKAAGYFRNEDMAKEADAGLIFWDRKSKGTKNMISCLSYEGKTTRIIFF